jgi:hypothetical protein
VTTLVQRIRPAELLLWPAIVASLLLVVAGAGLVAPLVPLLVFIVTIALLAAPLRHSAVALLGLAILMDDPSGRPMMGLWRPPLLGPGELLYLNLHVFTGVEALRLSALELVFAILLLVWLVRKLRGDSIDEPLGFQALPPIVKGALALWIATVVSLELFGIARHGDFRNSLWQLRQLFWLPILAILFGKALTTAGSRLWLLRVVLVAACIRALEGLYFYFVVCRRLGVHPLYTTSHGDSPLTVLAILLGVMVFVARPCRTHLILNLVAQPILVTALILNDRRIAYVSLAAGIVAILAMAPPIVRVTARRVLVPALLLGLAYTAVGWRSNAAIFRPVSTVRSLLLQDDRSSQARDIENYNLVCTLRHSPVVGSGFGHEYDEVVVADKISQYMPNYRFVAHNSVLWLLSVSGWLGFTLIWLTFPVGIVIALRVHRSAAGMVDRVTAFGAFAAILCLVVQAWGDMGLQGWMGTFLVASFLGAAAAMWPAPSAAAAEVTA